MFIFAQSTNVQPRSSLLTLMALWRICRHLTSRVQVGSPAIMRVLRVPEPVLEGN